VTVVDSSPAACPLAGEERRPRLLDLFCGAGGAAMGYHLAGFRVTGVDIRPQPHYPFEFHQMDALEMGLDGFDLIHASPPCQAYSTQTQRRSRHPQLIGQVRERLRDLPYVIENVEAARWALVHPARLCGSSFGLDLRRHRLFESNLPIAGPPCEHAWQTPRFRSLAIANVRAGKLATVIGVHGHLNYVGEFALRQRAMGIDWMTNAELVEAVPPAYTEHIGHQLRALLELAA
jgi:DNA (cytosine-5)-methyltransferase 1